MGYLLIAASAFLLDLAVKSRVDKRRELGEQTPLLKGRIILRKYYNRGMMLDALSGRPRLTRLLCGAAMAVLCGFWAALLRQKGNVGRKIGLSLVAGGGASNLYDRFRRGYVVDYFSIKTPVRAITRIIFNISDWCIFLGSALFALCRK